MKGRIATYFFAACITIVSSFTYSGDIPIPDDVKARLEAILTKSGGELHYFDGPGDMIGIGVSFINGKQMIVYATEDGGTIFSGIAIDSSSGDNISRRDMERLPSANIDRVFDLMAGANVLTEGNVDSENVYYVFVDPRCPYCHKTYDGFVTAIGKGQDLVVHYIPVGILGPESENSAKEMLGLSGEDGMKLFRKFAKRAAYSPENKAIAEGGSKLGANHALFRNLQFEAVPVVISSVGGKTAVRKGALQGAVIDQELKEAKINTVAASQ